MIHNADRPSSRLQAAARERSRQSGRPNVPGSPQAYPPAQGEDARDAPTTVPQPGADVVDPPGWTVPPVAPGADPDPLPAGAPVF